MRFSNIFKRKNDIPGEEGDDGLGKKAASNNSGLLKFYYSYDGTIGGNNYHFKIYKENDSFVFEYESMQHKDYGVMKMPVDSSIMDKLNDLYLSCRVFEWEGYSKYNSMVCDGKGFSLDIRFNDGKYMSASGTNAFPERYGKFYDGMCKILDPLCEKMLETARQNKINTGITGNITLLMIFYKQHGDSGSDEYKFLLSKSNVRNSNYEINVKSKSGTFFPAGEYNEYRAVPDSYIPFTEIQELINKYGLIKWYDHKDTAPDSSDREWYQIHFSFDDGSNLDSSGTVYLYNYDEFKHDFLCLMAKTQDKIKKDLL